MTPAQLKELVGRAIEAERQAILTMLRILQDDMTVRAIPAAPDVKEMVGMVVRDGVGSCIKLIEERSK